MFQLTRSSAQRSRPSSPYDDDAVATQEEPTSSDHEEDPEVSFHPHQPLPPHPVVNCSQWQAFICPILKVHVWIGQ